MEKQHSSTRLGAGHDTAPYKGATGFGSGSTAGAGYGNKTKDEGADDSRRGKVMEKIGGLFGKEELKEKGKAMREEAAARSGVEPEDIPQGPA